MIDNGVGNRWDSVEGFVKHEFEPPEAERNGDWDMEYLLIVLLEQLRRRVVLNYGMGSTVIIHKNGGFSYSGHSEKSLHYKGRAVDFHINAVSRGTLHPVKQASMIYDLTNEDFGIGIYTWGCHLDFRFGCNDRTDAVWFQDAEGNYNYQRYKDFHRTVVDAMLQPNFKQLPT